MFYQLNPTIPLATPRGGGEAIGVIDYSSEHDLMWVIIDDTTNEIWTTPNAQVRGFKNYSVGRNNKATFEKSDLDVFLDAYFKEPNQIEGMMRASLSKDHFLGLIKTLRHSEKGQS